MRKAHSLLLAAALSIPGCISGGRPTLQIAPPPDGWVGSIVADRAAKDEQYRILADTPIPASDLAGFRGLAYFPPDPRFRFQGTIEVYSAPTRFTIISTTGKARPCERYGRVVFDLDGTRCTLQVYRLLDIDPAPTGAAGFFLPFTDLTTGAETYPAGRYIDLEEISPGTYVLDFNRSYNPLCAYGAPERFQCPVTPAENRLAVRIEAGERGYKRQAALTVQKER